MNTQYKVSTVIPAYNERGSLPEIINRYKKAKVPGYQLVIVDNGSNDGTWEYLQKVVQEPQNKFIKIVKIDKNEGYGYGIWKGLQQCDAEIVGWSHGDLQCAPEDVFKAYAIYNIINDKEIFVKGRRKSRNWKELILTIGLQVYTLFILLHLFDDINGQPKIFHKSLLDSFKKPPKRFSFDLYAQNKALNKNYRVTSFPVRFEKRIYGRSKWAYSICSKISTIKGFAVDTIKMQLGIIR